MDIPRILPHELPPLTLCISDAVLKKLGEDLIRVLYPGVKYIVTESQRCIVTESQIYTLLEEE